MKKSERQFKKFLVVLHFLAFIHYAFALYYDLKYIEIPAHRIPKENMSFGGKFKYLTFINVVIMKYIKFKFSVKLRRILIEALERLKFRGTILWRFYLNKYFKS